MVGIPDSVPFSFTEEPSNLNIRLWNQYPIGQVSYSNWNTDLALPDLYRWYGWRSIQLFFIFKNSKVSFIECKGRTMYKNITVVIQYYCSNWIHAMWSHSMWTEFGIPG